MKLKTLTLSVSLILSQGVLAHELQIPESGASWYYSIGGERAISAPPSPNTSNIVLGGSLDWGSGFNCSAFNPTLGVANTLNNVKSGADAIQRQVVDAATGALASLPLLMLQRANPGLYELLMNSMASAEQRVAISTKSCEEMQQNISDGINPAEDWITISRSQDWKDEMGRGGYRSASVDAVQAQESVDKANGENGLFWIGGKKAGGRGQRTINIPTDIVKAGYNNTFNRDPRSDSAAPQDGSRLAQLWSTPEEVMAFTRSVLGEEKVRTYPGRPTETVPGRGLSFEVNAEVERLTQKFNKLISGESKPSGENLLAVSSPSVAITADTIIAMQALSGYEQDILKSRLIHEVATARTIEKGLMVLRLLASGEQEPNVAQNGPALSGSDKYSSRLAKAIDDTLFEHEMSKRLATTTSQTILEVDSINRRHGLSTPTPRPRPQLPSDTLSTENN